MLEDIVGEDFEKGRRRTGFGAHFLSRFRKMGVHMPENERRKYELHYDRRKPGSNHGARFKRYSDGEFSFCLTYAGELIASCGFDLADGAMRIKQIQGVPGRQKELKPFRWTHALVTYATRWARNNGVREAIVISVDHNPWEIPGYNKLDYLQGKLLYDATARACGFLRNKFGNYVLSFQERNQSAMPDYGPAGN